MTGKTIPRSFDDEIDDLVTFANENPEEFDEDDDVSLSASKKEREDDDSSETTDATSPKNAEATHSRLKSFGALDALRVVDLPADRMREYESFFYADTKKKAIAPFLDELGEVAYRVNCFYAFMRRLLQRGREFSRMDDAGVQEIVTEIYENIMATRVKVGSRGDSVKRFSGALMHVTAHCVARSEIYADGVDIRLGSPHPEQKQPPTFLLGNANAINDYARLEEHPYGAKWERHESWLSHVGERVMRAADRINQYLLGTSEISAKARISTLPAKFKFSEIESIFTQETGFVLPGTMVEDITYALPSIDQFLYIDAIRFPSAHLVRTVSELGVDQILRDGTLEDSDARLAAVLNDRDKVVPEYEKLNSPLCFTLRITLESDIAHFISQTPENKPASLVQISNWFASWAQYYFFVAGGAAASLKRGLRDSTNLNDRNLPRYVLPLSAMSRVSSERRANGLSHETQRGNKDGLYISPGGAIRYMPPVDARDSVKSAEKYEQVCEELYEYCARHGITVFHFWAANQDDGRTPEHAESLKLVTSRVPADDWVRMRELLAQSLEYSNAIISYDWDYPTVSFSSAIPGYTVTARNIGAKRPDDLAVADYLGMNLAKEGATPQQKPFNIAMALTVRDDIPVKDVPNAAKAYGSGTDISAFATSNAAATIASFYIEQSLIPERNFPTLQDLIKQAMQNLGYAPERGGIPAGPKHYDPSHTYSKDINPATGNIVNLYGVQAVPQNAVKLIQNLLRIALENASGNYGTGLYTSLRYELAGDPPRNVTSDEMLDALSESPLHFNPETSPMADFARTYNYLGGQVFKLILDKINSISDADLLAHKHTSRVYRPASEDGYSKEVRFNSISQNMVLSVVKPIAVLLGKYAPNKETIFASAKSQLESQQRDDSFTVDDLKVPGLNSDEPRAVFPHQLDTQSYLRKGANPPPFAVLGISPGGGKTGIGTMDIACIVKEMQSINVKIVPLVICPDNLIQTWCNDIKYFMGSNWNPFPLSGKIAERWGLERLQELASEAPTNTIFVAGMNFLNSAKQTFMIGSTQVKLSAYFEMVKRLNPNYIIIDESHKLKKNTSQRHNIVKMLTTMSSMRFLRIASGTLMPDRPRDIEAQVALYSPHIFRTGEFSDLTHEEILNKQENGEDIDEDFKALAQSGKIPLWKAGTPERARDKLASYSALVYKKRKEWAWMMPTPIEVFHTVNMVDPAATGREQQQQELHQALYEHVLHKTIEEIEDLIKKAKNKSKKKSDDDDDEKFDEEEEGNEGDDSGSIEGQIKTHLARIEAVMLAPQADEEYETIFGSFGEGYVPNKAKYVANLVAQHFHPPVWKREGTLLAPTRNGGMESRRYREYDLVKYGDDFYMARKIDMTSNAKKELPPEALGVSPDKLPEYWKKEPYGKLIIITRFKATAQAVYNALPTEYQRQTAVYTGDNKNKMEDFERFKTNKDVNILIANEQGMSEGHNLQMASRIIRVESPWGPGELDQTSARIFRPDPKGATSQADGRGEMYRDVVFLDWVITDNTVEVSKQARVISKIFATQRIEESNNPLYADVFKTFHVPNENEEPLLRLGLEALQNKLGLADDPFDNMREAYSALNNVIAREFHDMRVNGQAGLIKIEGTDNVAGAVIGAQMPFIAHQDIPDPHNWKPKTVHHLIQNDERYKTNPNLLIGMPVVTDLGTGIISSLNWGKGENRSKLSSIKVQLKNVIPGRKPTISFSLSVAYVPTNPISTADRRKYFDVDVKENAAERRAREKEEEALRKQEELERKAEEERKAQEKAEAIRRVRAKEDAAIRRKNEKENKPINQGVVFDPDVRSKVKTGVTPVVKGNNRLTVAPAYFHGYLTLEAEPETEDVNLKKLGFRHSGEYAYVACTTRGRLHAVFDYLEDAEFELSDATIARLQAVQKAFEKGARGKYVMELLPHDTLPFFFASQKRIVKNRREVRVFPILMHNHVMLAVHIPTCPAILQHINEAIPGAATKWQKSPGHWHYFANGKTDVRNKIAEIKRNGYSVTNEKEAIKELTEIQFRKPRATKDK